MLRMSSTSPLLTLHVSKKIVSGHHSFLRAILANQISEAVTEQLQANTNCSPELKNAVLKSPAFYGINSGFVLSEYIKNTLDAQGSQLDLYVRADAQGVICLVIDNGRGFSANFLGKKGGDVLVDYHTKIRSNGDIQLSSIASTKRGNTGVKGKEGLGIATIERILHLARGKLEIGNIQDIPASLFAAMRIKPNEYSIGAILALSSPLYSPEALTAYLNAQQNTKIATYGMESYSKLYTNYLLEIDAAEQLLRETEDNAEYSSPTQHVIDAREDKEEHHSDNASLKQPVIAIETQTNEMDELPGPMEESRLHAAFKAISLNITSDLAFGGGEDKLNADSNQRAPATEMALSESPPVGPQLHIASPTSLYTPSSKSTLSNNFFSPQSTSNINHQSVSHASLGSISSQSTPMWSGSDLTLFASPKSIQKEQNHALVNALPVITNGM